MAYPLLTDRLHIDPLHAGDVAAFVAYRQDPAVARWQSWEPSYSEADGHRLVSSQPSTDLPPPGEWLQLAVRDAVTQVLHGDVAVLRVEDQPDTFEIGFTLAPASQGRGIGLEAVTRVLSHLFSEGSAHRVVAFADARNLASIRLLQRAGMRHEASNLEADWCKGEWTSVEGHALLAREHAA